MTNFMAYDFSDSMTNFMTYDFFVPLYKHFQVVSEIQFAQNCHEFEYDKSFQGSIWCNNHTIVSPLLKNLPITYTAFPYYWHRSAISGSWGRGSSSSWLGNCAPHGMGWDCDCCLLGFSHWYSFTIHSSTVKTPCRALSCNLTCFCFLLH